MKEGFSDIGGTTEGPKDISSDHTTDSGIQEQTPHPPKQLASDRDPASIATVPSNFDAEPVHHPVDVVGDAEVESVSKDVADPRVVVDTRRDVAAAAAKEAAPPELAQPATADAASEQLPSDPSVTSGSGVATPRRLPQAVADRVRCQQLLREFAGGYDVHRVRVAFGFAEDPTGAFERLLAEVFAIGGAGGAAQATLLARLVFDMFLEVEKTIDGPDAAALREDHETQIDVFLKQVMCASTGIPAVSLAGAFISVVGDAQLLRDGDLLRKPLTKAAVRPHAGSAFADNIKKFKSIFNASRIGEIVEPENQPGKLVRRAAATFLAIAMAGGATQVTRFLLELGAQLDDECVHMCIAARGELPPDVAEFAIEASKDKKKFVKFLVTAAQYNRQTVLELLLAGCASTFDEAAAKDFVGQAKEQGYISAILANFDAIARAWPSIDLDTVLADSL